MSLVEEQITRRCLSKIKAGLKAKQITYKELSEIWQTSEVTIKRMLNGKDISLSRLIKLAELCGLETGQIIEEAKSNPQEHHFFTAVQDKAFAEEPHLLSYFQEIFHRNKSPIQIAKENNLTELSTYRYLRKLEYIELIKLAPENKFKFLVKPPLGFAADSITLKKEVDRFIKATSEVVMSDKRDKQHFMMIKPMNLAQPLFEKMVGEIRTVVDRYSEVSELMGFEENESTNCQVTFVAHPLNLGDFKDAKIISLD